MCLSAQDGDSAVIMATVHHHLPVLEELVRAGANLNLQNGVITAYVMKCEHMVLVSMYRMETLS